MNNYINKVTHKIVQMLNNPIKQTWWYKSNYGDAVKMKNWNKFNLDLATLGTSSVKLGLDYTNIAGINAANWAMQPQSIESNFAILKNYHSFIKEDGIVLLLLCPFNLLSLNKDKNTSYFDRYYYFLSPVLIENFNAENNDRIKKIIETPLFANSSKAIKAIAKKVLGKEHKSSQYLNAKEDAKNRIAGWKKQFSMDNLENPLSKKHLVDIEFNVNLLCEMISFCNERSLKPVLGIMPISKELKQYIPQDFMQKAFLDPMYNIIEKSGVQFLNYYDSSNFENEDLYQDSFLLNKKGAEVFTKQVLFDLGLLK